MNTRTFSGAILVICLSGYLTQAQITGERLYGITALDNQLITVDPTTGAGTVVGSVGASVSAYGLAYSGLSLYTFDQTAGAIRAIDPASGQAGPIIDIGVGKIQGEGDLAFRGDGTGFLATVFDASATPSNDLYEFNLSTRTSVRLGSTSVPLDGLAFDGATLFGLGQTDGTLYTVNQTTAALTAIGGPGFDKGSPFGAIAVAHDGTLFGAIDDRLYRIDKTTGLASALDPNVTDIGFSSVSGLAFAAVPEPSASYLLALAAGFALFCRRYRRAGV
ncbi:MAG: PEP-CTERM sorting domain-containing protein [Verrucomicrobiota bacterium]